MAKLDKKTGLLALAEPKKGLKPPGSARPHTRGLHKLAVHPTGSKLLQLGKDPAHLGGPGEPPDGFIGVWNSKTEWMVYWALFKLLDPDADPRKGPFIGIPGKFSYQRSEGEGFFGGRVPGGSVTDFVVATPTGFVGLRVETERWHIFTTADVQMRDLFIKTHLKDMQRVVSVYDQYFVGDTSGQQVIAQVRLALQGIEMPSPIHMGTAQRVRP